MNGNIFNFSLSVNPIPFRLQPTPIPFRKTLTISMRSHWFASVPSCIICVFPVFPVVTIFSILMGIFLTWSDKIIIIFHRTMELPKIFQETKLTLHIYPGGAPWLRLPRCKKLGFWRINIPENFAGFPCSVEKCQFCRSPVVKIL